VMLARAKMAARASTMVCLKASSHADVHTHGVGRRVPNHQQKR
jgi:hypothetical protein